MRKTLAIDANLLVLLVVGLTRPDYISTHKRLKAYSRSDFDLLAGLIAASAGVVVTPNALTEASNLLRQIGEPARTRIAAALRLLIARTSEIYIRSADAASRDEFLRLGLSDSALLELGRQDIVVLSVDGALCRAALDAGYDALNFNHLRDEPPP